MSGQQKTRFEQKVKKINNIPFQNYYEKIQTIIQILRLCKYQFTHYSAHQVNVFSFIHIATMHLTKKWKIKKISSSSCMYFFIFYFIFLHSTHPPKMDFSCGWGKKLRIMGQKEKKTLLSWRLMSWFNNTSKATIMTWNKNKVLYNRISPTRKKQTEDEPFWMHIILRLNTKPPKNGLFCACKLPKWYASTRKRKGVEKQKKHRVLWIDHF